MSGQLGIPHEQGIVIRRLHQQIAPGSHASPQTADRLHLFERRWRGTDPLTDVITPVCTPATGNHHEQRHPPEPRLAPQTEHGSLQGCHGTSHLRTRNRLPPLEGGRQPQCTGSTCATQRQRGEQRRLLQDGQRCHPQCQIPRHRDGDADPEGRKHPSHGWPGSPFRLQQCGGQPVHGQIHHHPDQAAAHHQREHMHLTKYQHTACEAEQETDPQRQQDEKHSQAAHDDQQQRQRERNAHATHPA